MSTFMHLAYSVLSIIDQDYTTIVLHDHEEMIMTMITITMMTICADNDNKAWAFVDDSILSACLYYDDGSISIEIYRLFMCMNVFKINLQTWNSLWVWTSSLLFVKDKIEKPFFFLFSLKIHKEFVNIIWKF